MTFDNNVPEWKNEGSDPPDTLKEEGFIAGYKPPAAYFNWFFNRIQKSVKEIQDKLSKDLKAMAFKDDIGGEDISETVIETLDTIEDKYPVPAAGESVKRFFGKVLTFLRSIRPLTGDINIYVSANTGSDISGDGSQLKPFKTIQHAIDIVPKDLGGYTAVIIVVAGTYPESLSIHGFSHGTFKLYGSVSSLSDAHKFIDVNVYGNTSYVAIRGFRVTSTTTIGISGYNNIAIELVYMKIVDNALSSGPSAIYLSECQFSISECHVAYHNAALTTNRSHGSSRSWTVGTNNNYGLWSQAGATIKKIGQQPQGNVPEHCENGGSIFNENGTQISGLISFGLSCTWGTIRGGYIRHGNAEGTAMVTVQLNVLITSQLSAGTQYNVLGFPSPSTGYDLSVAINRPTICDHCFMGWNGQMHFMPTQTITTGNAMLFNVTYLTNS